MYEVEYNKELRKYGVYRINPYTKTKLLCSVFYHLEEALMYVVTTINKEINNWPYDRL